MAVVTPFFPGYEKGEIMKNKTSLVFTGDLGFDKYMDRKWEDENLFSGKVREFLSSGDHLIVNVEGALSKQDKQVAPNGVLSLMHSMDPAVGDFLKDLGADIWNICNNHIMDAGPVGMEDTLKVAKMLGVKTVGAGMNLSEASKPLVLAEAGGIGMIGVGYQRGCKKAREDYPGCLGWDEMELIAERISEIKKTCRWCIVISHGGEEFTPLPSPYTRDRYLAYLDMGADIVISHHPHVPMNYEVVGDKIIFYSLGNFVFDTDYQRSQLYTDLGLLVRLDIDENGFSFEPFGLKINRETEHIEEGAIPDIFCDVSKAEYELLEPLSARAFVDATKRQQIYLNPDKYKNATAEEWRENFENPKRSGRVIGEGLDFAIICPIAEKEKEKAWKNSNLNKVVKYIQEMIDYE